MRIHALSCATFCPLGQRLVEGRGALLAPARLVTLCLLVEAPRGLILVDTGFGTQDLAHGGRLLPWSLRLAGRPRLDVAETALHQVRALGFCPTDVRHIVLTHLDLDHAGGLADFPQAQVHVHGVELEAARARRSLRERHRYLPRQWQHGPRWVEHRLGGDAWKGFERVQCVDGVALVPLPGHTRGHCAVAVPWVTSAGTRWIVHAGDGFFHAGELEQQPWCPPALHAFEAMVAVDHAARVRNTARLRALALGDAEVEVVCAHSAPMLDALRKRLEAATVGP